MEQSVWGTPDKMARARRKTLERFVSQSIKEEREHPDEIKLQALLDEMGTTELQEFWSYFTADRSFSAANAVPDWQTKRQEKALKRELMHSAFYPKEKDDSGKYIIVRDDFVEHVKSHIVEHICEKVEAEKKYKSLPLFIRIHDKIGFSVVLMVIFGILLGLLSLSIDILFKTKTFNQVVNAGEIIVGIAWWIYLLLIFVRIIVCKLNKTKVGTH
jgi:hypothetical protein